jgi:hypothetical protein
MIMYLVFVNFVLWGEKKQNELSLILSGFKHGHERSIEPSTK